MPALYLLNKPYRVLCQFTDQDDRATLADYIKKPGIYPAGRLDYDSEGLVALTGDGTLQARIAEPRFKLDKCYWVQVEGKVSEQTVNSLQQGVLLKDGLTLPAIARLMDPPELWERKPPIRTRKHEETSWLELTIREGRNRQVRRMTAAVGHPTLRLIRTRIGPWKLDNLQPGEYRKINVHLPKQTERSKNSTQRQARKSRANQKSPRKTAKRTPPKS